jgi:quercetin dioxygenase-like cupin family protein
MINIDNESNFQEILKGIKIKTLVHGKETLMSKFILEKDSILPEHEHPYEQTGYLISGNIILHIGEKTFNLMPGDSWCIKRDTKHKAEIIKNSVALEIFSPAREDYFKFLDSGSKSLVRL